ncbi:MAG TPA: hypothetical protein VHQ94_04005 [Pyrinomonadaceae bacterium]|jgi:peptidoglycan hydrolase CwlO-like protein|nr:hypothetical protein [Pyrinomonadaceae bacterium]
MSVQNRFQLVAIVVLATVVVIMLGRGVSGAETQDPASLDRRISMLEQRFYTLETSMNRLQQVMTSQRSTGSSSSVTDQEVDQLQAEVQRLQLRLNEVECGLVKLDERTTATGANRRGGEPRPADPCRQNPSTPLRLPSRP